RNQAWTLGVVASLLQACSFSTLKVRGLAMSSATSRQPVSEVAQRASASSWLLFSALAKARSLLRFTPKSSPCFSLIVRCLGSSSSSSANCTSRTLLCGVSSISPLITIVLRVGAESYEAFPAQSCADRLSRFHDVFLACETHGRG